MRGLGSISGYARSWNIKRGCIENIHRNPLMDTQQEYYYGLLDHLDPDGIQVLIIGTSWACPFSKRAEIALAIKGIPYKHLIKPHDDDDHHQLCNFPPHHQTLQFPIHENIPVLVHQKRSLISESQIIIQYIDETWRSSSGSNILPDQDPHKRVEARFWAKFIDEQCIPSLCDAFWGPESKRKEATETARKNLRALETELKAGNKRFFGGKNVGYVDIVAGFIGYWLGAIQEAARKYILTEDAFPLLCKWRRRYVNCRSVKDKLPPRKKLVAFYWLRMEAAKCSRTENHDCI